jgi:hypothetical protein
MSDSWCSVPARTGSSYFRRHVFHPTERRASRWRTRRALRRLPAPTTDADHTLFRRRTLCRTPIVPQQATQTLLADNLAPKIDPRPTDPTEQCSVGWWVAGGSIRRTLPSGHVLPSSHSAANCGRGQGGLADSVSARACEPCGLHGYPAWPRYVLMWEWACSVRWSR